MAGPQITYGSMLFYYNIDQMPQELKFLFMLINLC